MQEDTILVIGNVLHFRGKEYTCAIGKGGFSSNKHEGDGATPIGTFSLRECWYRADKVAMPRTELPLFITQQHDGWCDDAQSPDYNRHIILPFSPSHELLWREDNAYDLIVPLGYNDDPIIPGKGSAIFMHVAKSGYQPTEGCVALAADDLVELLVDLGTHSQIEIRSA